MINTNWSEAHLGMSVEAAMLKHLGDGCGTLNDDDLALVTKWAHDQIRKLLGRLENITHEIDTFWTGVCVMAGLDPYAPLSSARMELALRIYRELQDNLETVRENRDALYEQLKQLHEKNVAAAIATKGKGPSK